MAFGHGDDLETSTLLPGSSAGGDVEASTKKGWKRGVIAAVMLASLGLSAAVYTSSHSSASNRASQLSAETTTVTLNEGSSATDHGWYLYKVRLSSLTHSLNSPTAHQTITSYDIVL